MKIERRHFEIEEVEVRTEEDKPPVITGYAARFDKLSVPLWGFREKIARGAFAKSLREETIKALWNHNSDMVLGSTKNSTLRLWEDDKGLRFELELPDTSWGRDAQESIRRGDVDGVSFGFETRKDQWEGEDDKNVVRTLLDVRLIEISPTPFPAYPQTKVSSRSVEEVFEEYRTAKKPEINTEIEAERQRRLRLLALRD
jgi:HK97 family phage prohead protease